MTLLEAYDAIRDAYKVLANSAWGTPITYAGVPEVEPSTAYAVVRLLGNVEMVNETPVTDTATFTFLFGLVEPRATNDDRERWVVEHGSLIRDAVLNLPNPGNAGFMPMVIETGREIEDFGMGERNTVYAIVTVRASVDR